MTVTTMAMDTATEPAPGAARSLLQLMWLASPALPVGGFSYSEALEAAVESGRVRDEAAAGGWLLDQLQLSLVKSDLAAMLAALAAWRMDDLHEVEALNGWLGASRETAESRLQTQQMGRSLADWLRQRLPGDARVARLAALAPAPTWPVAWALAAAASGASARDAGLAYAFGWAENLAQAALKSVPLGQSAGQRILARLAEAIPGAVEAALALPAAGRQAHAPMLAILGAQHEVQYSRLFRS